MHFDSVYKFAEVSKLSRVNLYRWTDLESTVAPGYELFIAIAKYLPSIDLRKVLAGDSNYETTSTNVNVANEDFAKYGNTPSIEMRLIETQQNMIERLNEENNRLTLEIKQSRKKTK